MTDYLSVLCVFFAGLCNGSPSTEDCVVGYTSSGISALNGFHIGECESSICRKDSTIKILCTGTAKPFLECGVRYSVRERASVRFMIVSY